MSCYRVLALDIRGFGENPRVSQSSFFSVSDSRLHFGLGAADKMDTVEVSWPSGQTDTLREGSHRQLMEAYLASGEKAQALRHYDKLRKLLREELGVAATSWKGFDFDWAAVAASKEEQMTSLVRLLKGLKRRRFADSARAPRSGSAAFGCSVMEFHSRFPTARRPLTTSTWSR